MTKTKAVLINCLGNRHIKIKNTIHSDNQVKYDYLPKENFRQKTQEIYDHGIYKTDECKYEILPDAIEYVKQSGHSLEKVILIASNQTDESVNHQDTVFVGKIFQDFYKDQYDVQIVEVTKDPSNIKAMYESFKNRLMPLLNDYASEQIVFCNSGGTPQQKTALSLLLEHRVNERLTVFDIKHLEGKKGEPELVNRDPIVEFVALHQAEVLIKQLQYKAAAMLFEDESGKPRNGTTKYLPEILHWCHYLSNYIVSNLDKAGNSEIKYIDKFKFPLRYRETTLFDSLTSEVAKYLPDNKQVQILRVHLSLAQYYAQTHDYILWLTWFYRFQESLLLQLFEKNTEVKLVSNYRGEIHKLESLANKSNSYQVWKNAKIEKEKLNATKANRIETGIPTQLLILMDMDLGELKELLDIFWSLNSQNQNLETPKNAHLDTLRNKLMHEGKGFGETEIKSLIKPSPSLNEFMQPFVQKLQLPEENIFNQINKAISNILITN